MFIFLSPKITTDRVELEELSGSASLSHTSFKVAQILGLRAQIELVILAIKKPCNSHFLEEKKI